MGTSNGDRAATIHVVCDVCGTRVTAGTGGLWVDQNTVSEREKAVETWETSHGWQTGNAKSYSGGDLMSYPPPVRWAASHTACRGPQHEYFIEAERISTWPHVADWTAHLMEKIWLPHTDWDEVLRSLGRNEAGRLKAV